MASNRVGKIYVELDLDKSRYMRAQQTLVKEAATGAKVLERNFYNLGIKSGATYDLMRNQAVQSFEAIKRSGRATADDLVRAEKAKAAKIIQINEQQYGRQKTAIDNLKNHWKAFSVVAIAATAAAVYQMKEMGLAAIKAASDLEEVTSKFNTVFGAQQKQAEEWSKILVDSYAMSTRESKKYLSSVQDLLVPMGMQAEAAARMSNEVVKLAADLGSFNNMPTAQVMDDIESALVGNFETMKKYGVILNETVVKQKALNMGLWDGKGMVDANTKAQVAYRLMVEGSTAAIGDMERTSAGYANQLKKLEANVEDLKAMLGNELLPTATDIVSKMNEWIKANDGLIEQKTHEAINSISESIKTIVSVYNSLPDGVIGAAGVGVIGRILTGSTPIGLAAAALVLLNAQLEKIGINLTSIPGKSAGIMENFENIWDVITGKRDAGTGSLVDGVSGMGAMLDGIGNISEEILPPLTGVSEKIETIADAIGLTDKEAEHLEKTFESLRKTVLKAENERAWGIQGLRDGVMASDAAMAKMERDFGIYMANLNRDLEETAKKTVKENEEAAKETYDLWMRAMDRVESGIADAFYGAFTGQFDGIEDAFDSMLDSMLRMLAEWASAATMFDVFGVKTGASWGQLTESGGVGESASGSAGGVDIWQLAGLVKSGYEMYSGESLIVQLVDGITGLFGGGVGTVGSTYTGMYAGITGAEVEAMIAAELAASEGIGVAGGAGAGGAGAAGGAGGGMSAAAAAGWAAAAVAAIVAITAIFDHNTGNTGPSATMTSAALGLHSDPDILFGADINKAWVSGGEWREADIAIAMQDISESILDSLSEYNLIYSNISDESQKDLLASLPDLSGVILEFGEYAEAGGPIRGYIRNVKDTVNEISDVEWGGIEQELKQHWHYEFSMLTEITKEQRDNISATLEENGRITAEQLAVAMGYTYDELSNALSDEFFSVDQILRDINEAFVGGKENTFKGGIGTISQGFHEFLGDYFNAYISEALTTIKGKDIFKYMSDDVQAGINSLTKDMFMTSHDEFSVSFTENTGEIQKASIIWESLSAFVGRASNEITAYDVAMTKMQIQIGTYTTKMAEFGVELTEAEIAEKSKTFFDILTNGVDDLDAAMEPVGQMSQLLAALNGQFDAYLDLLIKNGVALEKITDLEQMRTEAGNRLLNEYKELAGFISPEISREDILNTFTDEFGMDIDAHLKWFETATIADVEWMADRLGMTFDETLAALEILLSYQKEGGTSDQIEAANAMAEAAEALADLMEALRNKIAAINDIIDSLSETLHPKTAQEVLNEINVFKMSDPENLSESDITDLGSLITKWYSLATQEAEAKAALLEQEKQMWDQVKTTVASLLSSVDSTISSIKYSDLNRHPYQKTVDVQSDYNELLARAMAGGETEVQAFLAFAPQYLQMMMDQFGSSQTYLSAYEKTLSDLELIRSLVDSTDFSQKLYDEQVAANTSIVADLSDINKTAEEMLKWLKSVAESLSQGLPEGEGFANGGIATGPDSGYLALLHGTEVITPISQIGSNQGGEIQRPMNITIQIGNQKFDAYVDARADNVRVTANKSKGSATKRLYHAPAN